MKKHILSLLYIKGGKWSLFLCIFLSVSTFAQKVQMPEFCSVFLPSVLTKSPLTVNDVDSVNAENSWGQSSVSTDKYWIVYCNDNNVPAYAEPSDFALSVSHIDISVKLRIADIKNGYAFVYRENAPGSVSFPQISGKAEALGWVHMKDLLLWHQCPVGDNNIYRKAYVSEQELNNMLAKQRIMCHYHKTSEQGMDMNMYFIMQQRDNALLLARTPELSGQIEDELVGWVGRADVMTWSSRACIEPQWDEQIVPQLNAPLTVYEGNEARRPLYAFVFGEKDKKGSFRLPPNVMRMPVLDGDTPEGHYACALLKKTCRPFDNTDYIAATKVFVPIYSADSLVMSRKSIVISYPELNDVLKYQAKLLDIANTTSGSMDDRTAFVEEYKRLGDVFGKAQPLSENILNLTDTDYVSTEDFLDTVHAYRDKCDKLSRLARSSYKYTFKVGKTNYYIIELDMLP